MKKMLVVAVMAIAWSPAIRHPVYAADRKDTSGTQLCMLYTEACSGRAERFQDKIKKIQAQIATGATAYSPAEIDKLEAKLKAAEDQMDRMLSAPRHR